MNSRPRRIVFIAFQFLATIFGANQTLSAQATPKYEFRFNPSLDAGGDRVCVGDSVFFGVTAYTRPANKSVFVVEPVVGVTVTSSVTNPVHGTLKPVSAKTASTSKPPGSARFRFDALKPGMTQLRFAGPAYMPLTSDVKVISCQSTVTVTTVSKWRAGMDIIATIDSAVMDADAHGHFAGTANVNWKTSMIGGAGCGAAEYAIAPSTADLNGEIEDDSLVVKIKFQPRDFAGFAVCGPAAVSTSNIATPDSLVISVPRSGGTSTQTHAVTAKNGSFAGSVTIVVTTDRK